MVVQFTLQDLLTFLFYTVGISAGILLIYILWNIKKAVGILSPMIKNNQLQIHRMISIMPEIVENTRQISSNLRVTTDKVRISVPVILRDVESATTVAIGRIESAGVVIDNVGSGINETIADYKDENSSYSSYFHIFEEVLKILYRTFTAKV